ncbi:hypothetical protein [Streptomyces sp. RG80]|uniref:hypothetical protein n=1 Tax=Streptomyces sp. RG80 TaxID=3157340 RepID=UPI00339037F8
MPVQQGTGQGAAAFPVLRRERGLLVEVALGHGTGDPPLRGHQCPAQLDERGLLPGPGRRLQRLPQHLRAQRVGTQQQMQRHPLLGPLHGPFLVELQPALPRVPQELPHGLPRGGGDLHVLHVPGQLGVPGQLLEGAARHQPGKVVDLPLTACGQRPGLRRQRHGSTSHANGNQNASGGEPYAGVTHAS